MATRCWIRRCDFTVSFHYHLICQTLFMKQLILLLVTFFLLQPQFCMAQADRTPRENWCVQKAKDQNGDLVFITANLGYKNYAYKTEFPWCLEVNATTVNKNPNGHPTDKEAPVLNATEDIITAALLKVGATHFVGRATVNGYRELFYFVSDPEKANRALSQLAKKRQPREWEYQMKRDEQWQRVDSFLSGEAECL
jgi:hypothetical protein